MPRGTSLPDSTVAATIAQTMDGQVDARMSRTETTAMQFDPRLVEAVTWLLLADLMRCHEAAHGLQIAETHPGGGQYDCRTLFRPTTTDFGVLAHFNLQSGNAHFGVPMPPTRRLPELVGAEPDGGRLAYVAAALSCTGRRPVRKWLEARLGLGPRKGLPSWTRHSLTYAVMAGVAARFALLGPRVRWENGLEDTSGWQSDDPVRPEVRAVPALAAQLEAGGATFDPGRHPAQGAWILMVAANDAQTLRPVAVLDTGAVLYDLTQPATQEDLFVMFGPARRVGAVVNKLAALVADEP